MQGDSDKNDDGDDNNNNDTLRCRSQVDAAKPDEASCSHRQWGYSLIRFRYTDQKWDSLICVIVNCLTCGM